MATTDELKLRTRAFAKQLSAELGNISVSEEECWLAVVEEIAAEMGDAMATALVEEQSAAQAPEKEVDCPKCGKQGRYRRSRERDMVTRRGPATIQEPEYYTALAAASLFFPMTQVFGVEVDCPFSPGMLRKVVHAGSQSASFVAASKDLKALAEAPVSRERVERWTKRVGEERVVAVDKLAEAYQALQIPKRQISPTDQVPQIACVQMDGGRIQIRQRRDPSKDEPQQTKGYWRESLVGCLLRMTGDEHAEDPCPSIPKTFVDAQRMSVLSREIKGFSADAADSEKTPADSPDDRPERPRVLVKSVVATRQGIEAFGRKLISAAYDRGFSAAPRKAFVADGSATNWSVHRKHFSHYTPILDFTHAVCYVWAAAMAGRSGESAWTDYVQWAQWLWSGETDSLIAAVERRCQQLGPPKEGDETSPPAVVAKTLVYLKNQQSRMKYQEYRKAGLPITSSYIESTIKQINRRVKGTEKFWDQGAEPLLQLAADHLSETNDLEQFWIRRHQRLQPMRCYRTAA